MTNYRVQQLIVSGLTASVVSAASLYAADSTIADMDVAKAETNELSRQQESTEEPIRVAKESLKFMTYDELRQLYYRLSDPADRRTVWEEIDKRKNDRQETALIPQEEVNQFGAVNHNNRERMPELEEVQIVGVQNIASAPEDDEEARQSNTRESDPRKNRRNQRRTGNIGTAYSQ